MEQWIYDSLYQKGQEYGLPASVWFPIVMNESSGNLYAVGDGGNSKGLFQINQGIEPTTKRRMHSDFDSTRLSDVNYQADYFMPVLKATYDEGVAQGLSGVDLTLYVEKNGERPNWTQNVVNSITKYYNQFTSGNLNTTNSASSGNTTSGNPTVTTSKTGLLDSLNPMNKVNDLKTEFFSWGITVLVLVLLIVIFLYSSKEVLA